MEYRYLGQSGFRVPVLGLGTGTFGGKGPIFSAWGNTGVEEARRLVDICLDAGVTMFDTADVYSDGASEEVLGAALTGRRDRALISTKTSLPRRRRRRARTRARRARSRPETDRCAARWPSFETCAPSPQS